jgi:hypothetical protein
MAEAVTTSEEDADWPVFTADEPLEGFFARYPGYDGHLKNIKEAVKNKHIGLIVLRDRQTGVPVPVVAAMPRRKNGEMDIFPLAKLFVANPYEELVGPSEEPTPNQ